MCHPVCGMVHIKEPLLLIDKSSLCGSSGFPFSLSEWSLTICLTPYNRRSNVLSALLNKTFLSLSLLGNVLFNNALNTFYLRLYGVGHMVKDHSDSERGNLLMPHGYSFRLAARVLLYAPSHRQDSTYLCYTSRGALVGMRNRSTP